MKKITLLLTIISFNMYGQVGNPASVPADWKTFTDENYSIQYPPDWELGKNQLGAIFIIFSPVDTANPDFNKNVNLIIQDFNGQDMDLDKYNEMSVTQIKKYMPNDSITMDKRQKDGMGEYQQLIYSADENNNHLQFEQYYRIINGKAYVITLTTLQKQWDKCHMIGEQILNSFIIKQ